MLLDLNKMGALMRHVMTSALTNPQKYRGLMDAPSASSNSGRSEYDSYCYSSNKIYQDAVKSLPNPEPPDEYKGNECYSGLRREQEVGDFNNTFFIPQNVPLCKSI